MFYSFALMFSIQNRRNIISIFLKRFFKHSSKEIEIQLQLKICSRLLSIIHD